MAKRTEHSVADDTTVITEATKAMSGGGRTAHVPQAAKGSPQAEPVRRGVKHTPMHSDTPSGKGETRHY